MGNTQLYFAGVRGSVPAPLTSRDVEKKIRDALTYYVNVCGADLSRLDEYISRSLEHEPFTYGGNTSCVLVRYGDAYTYVLDMGTGLREVGRLLMPEMFAKRGLRVVFLISHVHWDHIQGLPFFAPLYLNKAQGICNSWTFLGGTTWTETAQLCLKGQMDPPTFPVSWEEIQGTTHEMNFTSVHHLMSAVPLEGGARVTFGKLNHPQETYGSRLEFPDGTVVAYTTDNEPFDPLCPDPRLVGLATGAQVWITDCQYTKEVYEGKEGGVTRHGWGHSYPEAVAATAVLAKVKCVVLFHHDPASSDERITEIGRQTQELIRQMGGSAVVRVAYEGLTITP